MLMGDQFYLTTKSDANKYYRLPWTGNFHLNHIHDEWHQIAVHFRRINGIRDGDLQIRI
ncbi:hypothetical protein PMIT1342_01810 [Prochlorococcus marinus str. MIT 1342]|nr:hypothetical protein PMIT1342_01810 [Prochlorococcus marinus str. MIT 1342]